MQFRIDTYFDYFSETLLPHRVSPSREFLPLVANNDIDETPRYRYSIVQIMRNVETEIRVFA